MQGGQTIEQIQKNSGARVQLSRAGEFYPGGWLLHLAVVLLAVHDGCSTECSWLVPCWNPAFGSYLKLRVKVQCSQRTLTGAGTAAAGPSTAHVSTVGRPCMGLIVAYRSGNIQDSLAAAFGDGVYVRSSA